jgi:hypothetical protein
VWVGVEGGCALIGPRRTEELHPLSLGWLLLVVMCSFGPLYIASLLP